MDGDVGLSVGLLQTGIGVRMNPNDVPLMQSLGIT